MLVTKRAKIANGWFDSTELLIRILVISITVRGIQSEFDCPVKGEYSWSILSLEVVHLPQPIVRQSDLSPFFNATLKIFPRFIELTCVHRDFGERPVQIEVVWIRFNKLFASLNRLLEFLLSDKPSEI